MKLDRLDIRTIDQKVEIHSTQPKLEMESTDAKVNFQQPAAILEMSSKAAKLLIDQSQAWRDMGLLTPMEAADQFAQNGMQAVAEGTARRAREGDQMMDIAGGQNQIQAIAESVAQPPQPQLGIKWTPSVNSVKTTYVPGELDINITPQKPRFDVRIGDVQGQYIPGNVTVTTVQRASVETTVIKGE